MSRLFSDRSLGLGGLALGATALLISLGGDAWAARAVAALKKNSVRSATIVNGAVKSADIATGGVQTGDIKTGTIGLLDLSPVLRTTLAKTGPAGATGATGDVGPAGPAGPPGPGVTDGSITTDRLANDAVTSPKVAPDTLLATDIATNAVGTAEIATNAVTATEIGAGAVASSEILDGSLTALDVTKASEFLFVDFPALAAGTCSAVGIFAGVTTTGEIIAATPDANWPQGVMYATRPAPPMDVAINVCNVTGAQIDPPGTNFHFVVLDA